MSSPRDTGCPLCVGGTIYCNRSWFLDEATRLRALAEQHERTAQKCLHLDHEQLGRKHRLQGDMQ